MTALPSVEDLPISGLKLIQLDLRSDQRGWFAEVWQSAKFADLGLANFQPTQANASLNEAVGTTRGLHAEPWAKLIYILSGSAFGAWVDLREGAGFGAKYCLELRPGMAVYVPSGVANGFQTTSRNTTYGYLVDGLWSKDRDYKMLNAFDKEISIPWPTSIARTVMSQKDLSLPPLSALEPIKDRSMLILGSGGQLGKALAVEFVNARNVSRTELVEAQRNGRLSELLPSGGIVLNAAALTAVDRCESVEGFAEAIRVNYHLVQGLAEAANTKLATLVHFSSDYVFDGHKSSPYTEEDLPNPINNYGISKLLGDLAAQIAKKHYIFRLSWSYGDGGNFVATMANKARHNERVRVASDQYGRPSYCKSLAASVREHLALDTPFGIYNLTDLGEETSWYQIAERIYETMGADPRLVTPIQGDEVKIETGSKVKRPRNCMLSSAKSRATGVNEMGVWQDGINEQLNKYRL
jgi:dTDP-4-dehydrorhamnose 3,5-epimerase